MSYASDKLYRQEITGMMARLATDVKVREITPHLPCLTPTDREEIEAKRETAGNYNAMVLLLENLRRRERWPEHFIRALRNCEHRILADEISNAYDQIRGIRGQAPAAAPAATPAVAPAAAPAAAAPHTPSEIPIIPMSTTGPAPTTTVAASTTVTTATIHSVPQSPLLTPEESGPNVAHPVRAPEVPAVVPPEPAHSADPLQPVSPPQERPPSPILAPDKQIKVLVSPGSTSTLGTLTESPSDAAPDLPTKILTTPLLLSNTSSNTLQPSAAPEESQEPVAPTGSPSSLKRPIQDSHPPGNKTYLSQNSKNSTTINQPLDRVHTSVPQNRQTRTAHVGIGQPSSVSDDSTSGQLDQNAVENELFSKPGTLVDEMALSVSSDDLEISRANTGTEVSPVQPVPVSRFSKAEDPFQEPCSITSADLMISSVTTKTTVHHTENLPVVIFSMPTESVPVANTGASGHSISNSTHEVSTHPENVIAPFSNQPVEDHYESFCSSLQSQPGTLEHTAHFSENPSIPNLDGCSPRMQHNVVHTNDKPANHNTHPESVFSPVTEHQSTLNRQDSSGLNASAMINTPQSEQKEGPKEGLLGPLLSDPRLVTAAAAAIIGVTAVFFAWKLKYKY